MLVQGRVRDPGKRWLGNVADEDREIEKAAKSEGSRQIKESAATRDKWVCS